MKKRDYLLTGILLLAGGLLFTYVGYVDDLGFSDPTRTRGIVGLMFRLGGYKTVGPLLVLLGGISLFSWNKQSSS